jgi:hypothetical protein
MSNTVPCQFCDKPTPMLGTKMCNACWSVERGLRDFLRTQGGMAYTKGVIAGLERVARTSPYDCGVKRPIKSI